MIRILFVCTGNTCRSPMAEAILKNKGIAGVEVKSAGVYASNGSEASINTKAVLDAEKIAHNHQSSMLTDELVKWSTYILTMTSGHKSSILSLFPDAAGKTFTLKEFIGNRDDVDISDPFGGSMEIYQQTYKEIKANIEKLIEKL